MDSKTPLKLKLWHKLIAVPSLVLFFFLFMVDRFLHLALPHVSHGNFKSWVTQEKSFKHTIARIIIVIILVVLFKLIF
tara:strand:+ start:12812 stop:13045 length:234 start_codon:yes stop_codon:yes gene_type:complete